MIEWLYRQCISPGFESGLKRRKPMRYLQELEHSQWLSMMYPRLKLGKSLLTRDGAMFVSCDEAEHPRLRAVLDEIFGVENFVADFVWAAGRKNDSRLVSISHEYIVCYARDAGYLTEKKIEWRQREKGLEDIYQSYERLIKEHNSYHQSVT